MDDVRLPPGELRALCDPDRLPFETTAELEELGEPLGQERALEAVELGVGIVGPGFNLFAIGPPGLGKQSLVSRILEQRAEAAEPPSDWCHVNDFSEVQRPRLLRLPAGRGRELERDMKTLVEELTTAITAAFESEEYQTRRQLIDQEVGEKQEKALSDLEAEAREQGLALVRTPMGIVFAPLVEGEVLSPEEFQELPEEEREQIGERIEELQGRVKKIFRHVPRLQRERRERVRELDRMVTDAAVDPLLSELRSRYEDLDQVVEFLDAVEEDAIEHARLFVAQESQRSQQESEGTGAAGGAPEPALPRRYGVNVLVDHTDSEGAPVVYEDNPTFHSLVGRVEHVPRNGALVTDFSLIRPGALHRANGGYLIVDVDKLLVQPFAWAALKRALKSGKVAIESPAQAYGLISTYSLEPEPMPLDLKVVLLGNRFLYQLLSIYDPEFGELFKVAADFGERTPRSDGAELRYARLLARLTRENELLPLGRGGVARVIEHSSRLVGDRERLSLAMSKVLDLLREADHRARSDGAEAVEAVHVEGAIEAAIRRSDRIRERIQEEIHRGTILIDSEGDAVGQINGLAVLALGDFSFGRPHRISARVRLGSGELIDIEREVELGGPLHSKGVMILAGYLGGRFARQRPLSISASLVFEQSYGGVDGDSASSAELYALLSAIAEVPLDQGIAVTGSVNQRGEIQAIGGVNEKVEGFFDVCAERGLTGEQGVLIPASNVQHLMLHRRVVDAVADGRFHVWPVATVDRGIELLTAMPAGEADEDGEFPEGTFNRRVADGLAELARTRRRFRGPRDGEDAAS